MSKTFIATTTLAATVIGAGFLGIPYVAMQSGFSIAMLHIIGIAILLVITMLYLGEISLRTKTKHQLTGYAEKYLGKKGKKAMFIAVAFGIYAAILAYIIAESQSLSVIIFGSTANSLYLGIGFWIIMSLLVYRGLKVVEEGASIGIILIIFLITSITVLFWNKISLENLSYTNTTNWYVPFGVILFAFLGESAIPTLNEILKGQERLMKRTIVIAYLLIFFIYAIFTLVVLGSQGPLTPKIATLTLGKPFILLGIITIFTSYLSLSFALMNTFRFDFNVTKNKAWLYTILIPIIMFITLELTNKTDFIKVLGIGGVISGGMTAILTLLMIKNAKKLGKRKPEYSMPYSRIIIGSLIIIYILGAALEIFHVLK